VIITSRNLLRHLLARKLVSNDSVVDGDLIVVDASGRNRNFKVIRKRSPSFFVKQIRNWNPQAAAMLQCEAACYFLANNDPDFIALAPLIPELYDFDPDRQTLTTAFISDGEDLFEYLRRTGKISTEIAGELGRCFGKFHRESETRLLDSPHCSVFPKQIPWILSSERRNSHPFKELSPATSQLFDHVDASTQLSGALDELRKQWRVSTLMHGDMRLENCILVQTPGNKPGLKIVDWELADLGDPGWDIGSILQAFLAMHIISIPPLEVELTLSALLLHPAATHLCPPIRSFWEAYARELPNSKGNDLFERCLSYGAARMVQSAYEYMQFSPHLSGNALHLLEVSSDILTNPPAAAEQLLN
jgi:Phosphotransferase enzyme family